MEGLGSSACAHAHLRRNRNIAGGGADAAWLAAEHGRRMAVARHQAPSHVLIAGAGMAGIEAALALREFAADGAAVTVIEPNARFSIAATATGSAFGIAPSIDVPLLRVVARAGATLRRSRVVAVDGRRRLAMLAGGELVGFDTLVVAVGAHLMPHLPQALTFRGHADVDELRELVECVLTRAGRGGQADLVVVIPARCGWPLAGYEIALMARELFIAAGHGDACRVAVVTAEDVPLAMFGPRAGGAAARTLRRVDVEIVTTSEVRAFDWGQLVLGDGTSRPADRVVSLPVMRGPALAGLPTDADGFVRCDADGTVARAPNVRVVGDAGTFPVKRGAIACQQADSVAASIARALGIDVDELPFTSAMPQRAWDWGDGWLLSDRGPTAAGSGEASRWWPVPKMAGRFLAPFLHDLAPAPTPLHLVGPRAEP